MPQPTPTGAARVLLQAFVTDMRSRLSETELADRRPLHVARADLKGSISNTVPIGHQIEGWLIRYTGGPTATAVSQDSVRVRLDATRPHEGATTRGNTTLAVIETADRVQHMCTRRQKR